MNIPIGLKKNPFVRKSIARLLRIPRFTKRLLSINEEYNLTPPVLVNSFPKSGTHLLVQIVEAIPGAVNYGTFIASMMSSMIFRERPVKKHIKVLKLIVPNEIVSAHLFYLPDYEKILNSMNCVHFFIYRDLRDVVISEVHYLTFMNRWHRLHPYYKKLPDLNTRISLAINGFENEEIGIDYPNIAKRFKRYSGWLESENVCAIKFEDLVGKKRRETIERMMVFYQSHLYQKVDISELVEKAIANINPQESHTFRKGEVNQWQSVFNEDHNQQFERVAGDLLREIGY